MGALCVLLPFSGAGGGGGGGGGGDFKQTKLANDIESETYLT